MLTIERSLSHINIADRWLSFTLGLKNRKEKEGKDVWFVFPTENVLPKKNDAPKYFMILIPAERANRCNFCNGNIKKTLFYDSFNFYFR